MAATPTGGYRGRIEGADTGYFGGPKFAERESITEVWTLGHSTWSKGKGRSCTPFAIFQPE